MKIGRNDPCHCGSGKKYKKCCLNNSIESQEFSWAKIHKSRNDLIEIMMKFAIKKYGEESIIEAWEDFHCWKDELPEFDCDSYQLQVFMPWFLYDWTPDPDETTVMDKKYHGTPIGQALLDTKNNKLSSLQFEYIEKCLIAPFSFFEIIKCRKGEGYQLKDLFTFEEYNVVEKKGSEVTEAGDILFGKLVTMEGITTLEACSPFGIPPGMKLSIIDLRNHIKEAHPIITDEILKRYDFDFLDLYHHFHESIMNPAPPRICNTDGDDMIPQELIYQIDSIITAFEKLHVLDIISTKEELLRDAILGEDGKLKEVEFSWQKEGNKKHKSWDNTILGHIKLTDRKMVISVNSNKRAEKIKKIVNKSLGKSAVYKNSVIEDLTPYLEGKIKSSPRDPEEQNTLMNNPEVQEKIKEMNMNRWAHWVNEKIPALGGKTPKQASKSKDGKELLDGLLMDFERNVNTRPQIGVTFETFQKIRKDLGIEKEE